MFLAAVSDLRYRGAGMSVSSQLQVRKVLSNKEL